MIFADTETTGLLQPEANDLNRQPHIIELYLVRLNYVNGEFEFVNEFHSMFKPPMELDPIITKITGITDAMLTNAPVFAARYDELCDFFLGETTFIAHNLAFDLGMLWTELARIQCETKFPFPKNHHCTVELSMGIKHHRLKLKDLHELATGKPHEGQHRARGDVEALVKCYAWMLEEGYIL